MTIDTPRGDPKAEAFDLFRKAFFFLGRAGDDLETGKYAQGAEWLRLTECAVSQARALIIEWIASQDSLTIELPLEPGPDGAHRTLLFRGPKDLDVRDVLHIEQALIREMKRTAKGQA